jgi:hypothetical protein
MRVRCEECEACKHPDCGECKHCLAKKKFGGDGSNKFACIRRRCKNMQPRNSDIGGNKKKAPSSSAHDSSSTKPPRSSSSSLTSSSATNNVTSASPAISPSNHSSASGRRSPSVPRQTKDNEFTQHPASVLDVSSTTRKRKRTLLAAQRAKENTEAPTMPFHMCGLPIPKGLFGVCGECGVDGEHDTIILCDGEG